MSTKLLQLQDQSLNPKPSPATTKASKTGGSSEPARARSGSRGWRGVGTLYLRRRGPRRRRRARGEDARAQAGSAGGPAASAPRGPRAPPAAGPRRRRAGGSRSPPRRRRMEEEVEQRRDLRRHTAETGSPIGGGALERQRVRIDRPRGARVLLTLLQVFVLERERRERKRERRDGRGEEERRATMMTKSLVASTGVGVKVFSLFLFPTVRFLL